MIRSSAFAFAALVALSFACTRREPPGQCFVYCHDQDCLLCDDEGCERVHSPDSLAFGRCSGAEMATGEPVEPAPPQEEEGAEQVPLDPDMDLADDLGGGHDAGDGGCSGSCPPAEPDPALVCDADHECGGGDCVSGRCHAPCATDADCGTGDVCIGGTCDVNPAPPDPCVFSSDCPVLHECVDSTCFQDCAEDADCPNPTDFCDRGLCRPDWRVVSECLTGGDCAAGEDCVDGQCLTPCFDDADCVGCADGPVCSGGYCQGGP